MRRVYEAADILRPPRRTADVIESPFDRLAEPSQIVSEVAVIAPANGAVIARSVNVGQVVGGAATRLVIPRPAVQAIGARKVVYVATEDDGRCQERTVRLGAAAGDSVEVLEGLKARERVVSEGSFFLRAEADRARNSG